ncbi:MAG: DUF4382 domain-containing protein [Gammaproteobacteria bacterium]|nr:DUF4382 domain-containing protein [Gammaproteobacteria bacterium]MDE2345840.1 DUF4382 domain-containing protein [Gammaproteobacteria bacterium]
MTERNPLRRIFALLFIMILTAVSACGGGSDSTSSVDCSLAQNQSSSACGAVAFTLGDATGDFISYVVTVDQVTLVRSDGLTVNALAAPARMDLAQLVDGSALMASAYIPSGTYTSLRMSIDYGGADIEAEDSLGGLVKLTPVDSTGTTLATVSIPVQLAGGSEIVVQQGVSTLTSLDFDLAASNIVNLGANPPTVTVNPVLFATSSTADLPTSVAQGLLTGVSLSASTYSIQVQPLFYLGNHTFGSLTVATGSATAFEINGAASSGSTGLQALAALPDSTPTLAYGTFSASDGSFEAEEVYAGTSVPGATLDSVDGSVLARSGDVLTVRGVVYVQSTGTILYHSLVSVTLGTNTVVHKAGDPAAVLAISHISVGQRVAILGTLTDTDPSALALDAGSATTGYVRLAPATVDGTLLTNNSGQLTLNLAEINHHRVSWYDFSGTGSSSVTDADPANYEVDASGVTLPSITLGSPVEIRGFVQSFGAAPPDFTAEEVGNYVLTGTRLMANWRPNGSATPFSTLSTNQIIINLSDPNLGPVAVLRRGGDIIDLTALPASPLIVPPASGLGNYAIRQAGVVTVYVSFSSFAGALQTRLNGTTVLVGLFATGGYDNGTFTATRLAVQLK